MEKTINITLRIWRQKGPKEKGAFKEYSLQNISTDSSFLEMLDVLNEQLINEGEEPVVFALYQRTSPRTRRRCNDLPAAHA